MVRDDLADVDLADRVFAPHYARAMPRTMAMDETVHVNPQRESDVLGHAAQGDPVDVYDISGGWAWIRCSAGAGYVPVGALDRP
jgi:hypothetical protein